MKTYSCGFLFWQDEILLMRKNRPPWQHGYLNGVGGHIEEGETPAEAMAREFMEEAGLDIPAEEWNEFLHYSGPDYTVHFFKHTADYELRPAAHSRTSEPVIWYNTSYLPHRLVPNLWWIIPLAMCPRNTFTATIAGNECRLDPKQPVIVSTASAWWRT